MEIICGAFLIACFIAAVYDFLVFKLPNVILLFIILLFILKGFLLQSVHDFIWPIIAFFGILCVGFFLYLFKWIGAGDAQFIAVASLWTSQINLTLFLLTTSIAGGVLAVMYLKFHPQIFILQHKLLIQFKSMPYFEKIIGSSDPIKKQVTIYNKKKTNIIIPYGIAVFVGVLSTCLIEK